MPIFDGDESFTFLAVICKVYNWLQALAFLFRSIAFRCWLTICICTVLQKKLYIQFFAIFVPINKQFKSFASISKLPTFHNGNGAYYDLKISRAFKPMSSLSLFIYFFFCNEWSIYNINPVIVNILCDIRERERERER